MDPNRRHETDSSAGLEEEEEAFLDVNDPDNEILDDGLDDAPISDDDDDDDLHGAGGGAHGDDDDEDDGDAEEGDEEAEEEPKGIEPTEKDPERDDAVLVFAGAKDGKSLHCVSFNPKNPRISAVAGESDEVYVLDAGTLTHTLTGHTDTITHIRFSPDGSSLATGCMDNTIKLWDASSFALLHTLADLSGEIECLLWHPTGLMIVGGATDAQAVMWNAKKGSVAQYFVGHRGSVTCAEWACDTKKLITGSADGSVMVFNPKTAETEVVFPTKDMSKDNAGVTCLADLGAGDVWAAGCEDGTIHVLSIPKGKVVNHFPELHAQSIEAMQAAPALGFLLTASCDCNIIVWNIADASLRTKIVVGEGVTSARWLGYLIVAGCTDGDIRVWDGRAAHSEPVLHYQGHRRFITSFEIVVGTNLLLTTSDDGTARAFPLPAIVK